jgi:formylglycine-generating enzyme required for sulfatase activity
MEFILIPAGEFYMGSPGTEKDRHDNEGPIHQVRMSRSFYMSKYEVTQDQYLVVTGVNPSDFKEGTRPVENVPWEDAVAFCKRLSDKHAASFRLPTEAEWEYACRGGTQTRFSYGDDPDYSQLGDYAWYLENSDSTTHSVGSKKPNAFGLYDMHGSVYEWCSDWYAAEQYRQNPAVDPQGPLSGQLRVCRGGSWYHIAGRCRSADRVTIPPDTQDCRIGFRVALDLE